MEVAGLLTILMFVLLITGILSGIPAWLAIGGAPLVVALIGSVFGAFDLVLLSAFPQRVLGMTGNQLFIAIPLFVLTGVVLEKSGLAVAMLDAVTRMGKGSPLRLSLDLSGLHWPSRPHLLSMPFGMSSTKAAPWARGCPAGISHYALFSTWRPPCSCFCFIPAGSDPHEPCVCDTRGSRRSRQSRLKTAKQPQFSVRRESLILRINGA